MNYNFPFSFIHLVGCKDTVLEMELQSSFPFYAHSIAISPANSSHVAYAGCGGAEFMDLRNKRYYFRLIYQFSSSQFLEFEFPIQCYDYSVYFRRICSFPSPKRTTKIQFNGRGSRLLCIEEN